MNTILNWHPAVSVILLCIITISISYIALRIVRKKFSNEVLKENHEVGGFIFNAFGLIYAVLIAFVVFVTWTEFDESRKNVDMEASELADLYNGSQAMPGDIKNEIRSAIEEYILNVQHDEWPRLENGMISDNARTSYHKLINIFTRLDAGKITNEPVYRETLKHLNGLGEKRRDRIFDSRNDIPGLVWGVLLFGGVMTVFYTFFFSTKKLLPQFLMTAGLAGLNTMILYMICILDQPFRGYTKITPEAFNYVLEMIKSGM